MKHKDNNSGEPSMEKKTIANGEPAEGTEPNEPMEHEVKSAADDMMRIEEHKKNHKLMAKVHEHLHGKAKAIKSIQDLKDARNDMNKKESEKMKGY